MPSAKNQPKIGVEFFRIEINTMDVIQVASLLLVLAAAFGVVNYLYLRLPPSIGILVVALVSSLAVLGVDWLLPFTNMADTMRAAVLEVHFSDALLEGMLGLLLFAGALHVKISDLRAEAKIVLLMATLGVALSTVIAGLGFSLITGAPLLIALVFGALISPTDPVAVLGVLKAANLPKSIETKIAGESLFNDGVGYVTFLVLAGLAFPAMDGHQTGFFSAIFLFLQEVIGGAIIGGGLGWLTFQIMKRIDDYSLEVLLTLALAAGGYSLSLWLHVSAPIMAVVAGLMIGEAMVDDVMSKRTREHVDIFWRLIDEILNAVLFLMIGFEIFAVTFTEKSLELSLLLVAIVLLARLAAVAIPILWLEGRHRVTPGVIPIMTWGGLKGGISVALVLSLPDSDWSAFLLTATYVVVIFSIIVQGLTIAPLAKALTGGRAATGLDRDGEGSA